MNELLVRPQRQRSRKIVKRHPAHADRNGFVVDRSNGKLQNAFFVDQHQRGQPPST